MQVLAWVWDLCFCSLAPAALSLWFGCHYRVAEQEGPWYHRGHGGRNLAESEALRSSAVSPLLSLACCCHWPEDPGSFLILPNAEFHKAYKIFQRLEPARECIRNMSRRKCMMISTTAFSTGCINKQIPVLTRKAALRLVQKTAIPAMVPEWYFLGSSFSKAPVNHSKRHTLYRCEWCTESGASTNLPPSAQKNSLCFFHPNCSSCQS